MCGRFFLDADFEDVLRHYFGVPGDYPVSDYEGGEIFPSNAVPVIHRGKDVERTIHLMKWGFAPVFMKKLLINARSETIKDKPVFKEAFERRRCLIPASGYYEWETIQDDYDKLQKVKRTIRVPNESIISLAGIYDRFMDTSGKPFWAVTILTKASNADVRSVHDRMPVVLNRDAEKIWIGKHVEGLEPLLKIIQESSPRFIVE